MYFERRDNYESKNEWMNEEEGKEEQMDGMIKRSIKTKRGEKYEIITVYGKEMEETKKYIEEMIGDEEERKIIIGGDFDARIGRKRMNGDEWKAAQVFGFKRFVPVLDGRIVGGLSTTIDRRPYQLSLQTRGNHICGASIIGPNVALTAAHCTDGMRSFTLSVRSGSTYRGSGGQVHQVVTICQHPLYNSALIDYDVAVVKINPQFQLSNNVKHIPLQPVNQEVPVGAVAVVSGWGTTTEGGSSSQSLQEVSLPHVSDQSCKQSYGSSKITQRMFCFGYTRGGQDSCQGDSGGPLVYNGAQVGIVSWGNGCARHGYPGVYTKISNEGVSSHIHQCAA
ncbi:hypothetical protein FQR65_LT18461 [Abscondita terminalis]|nr:hypothetical protein FQR65_LT18461 [Abscondita terminalis]